MASATQAPQPAVSGAPPRAVVLRTSGLTKRFGTRTAVNNLSLEVHQGDVFGLLGPNGSGKTTTLRMILGLIWPNAGEIAAFGTPLTDGSSRRAALQRIGAVVEQPAFYPYLSGRENLLGIAVFAGLPRDAATTARVNEVLASVSLAERATDAYRKYSLGMKQRLGIAAALLTKPDLVVLDEPTNGLDPAGVVEVRALITNLSQQGITVLLSSHLLHEVQQVCTRMAILKDGNLLAQGSVAELLAAQSGIQLAFADAAQLPRAVEVLRAAAAASPWLRGAQYIAPEPGGWVPPGGWALLVDAPAERAAEINALLAAQGIFAAELRRREGSLEQYFLSITTSPAPGAVAPSVAPIAALPGGQA